MSDSSDTGEPDLSAGRFSDRARRRARWAVPVAVIAAVGVGAALTAGSASGARPSLPARTAAQLLTAVQGSDVTALSGEVTETANLGVPSLPGGGGPASLSWQSFISGTHTARVWADGADKQRLALIGQLSEADVVHNGSDLWTYTSDTNTVTHTVLSKADASTGKPDGSTAPDARDLTPAAAAQRLLDSITPSTTVTVDPTRTVAGRAAYTLALAPKDTNSTVSKVTIAIDAAKYVPLQVQVFGKGSKPAFQTGFTKISFSRPAASTFAFTPPAGAKTSTSPFTGSDRHHHGTAPADRRPSTSTGTAASKPTVLGKDWTSVLEVPTSASKSLVGALPGSLTTSVGNGVRLLHTALVNAVLLPDGRVFLGAVDAGYLEHLAATTPR